MDEFTFVNPTTLQPLFTTQQVICAYPISDLYASSPRYLYYALLALCFVTHWTGWLANVFLGAAATYAGTAAIQAFILRANQPALTNAATVTIPVVASPVSANLTGLRALITNEDTISIQPATLELDIDPVLAICVIGYLVLLPMQCWSRVAKANRARHILITVWNMMMLAGAIVALTLWPKTLDAPTQYRFCYPTYSDPDTITNDGWLGDVWKSDWNTTIWSLFSNFSEANTLSDNCFYPCFNTTQVLRKTTSITASLYSSDTSPRINWEDLANRSTWITTLPGLMYLAFGLTAIATLYLTVISWLKSLTQIPVGDPRLLWARRKELWCHFRTNVSHAVQLIHYSLRNPKQAHSSLRNRSMQTLVVDMLQVGRFWLDVLTVIMLVLAMVFSPLSIIAFLVWIEWYIRHDGHNGETPRQVGQWTSSVAVGLILISAVILQLKYRIASSAEIQAEIQDTRAHLIRLETLLETKEQKKSS